MTVLFMESFDLGGLPLNKWDASSNPTISSSFGLHGNGALGGDQSNLQLKTKNFGNIGTVIFAFNFRATVVGVTGLNDVANALESGTIQWKFRWDSVNEKVVVATAANVQIAASSNGSVPLNVWTHVAFKVTTHTSTGAVNIQINGAADGSGSGDTQGTANAYVQQFHFLENGSANLDAWNVDDFVVMDTTGAAPQNDFLGAVAVGASSPDGNGNSSVLVGSDGNSTDNYLLVDELPFSASDYVGSATEGDKDTYTMSNLPAGASTVYAMQVSMFALKSDTGTKFMRPVVRSGGTDFTGTSVALGETAATIVEVFQQNPDGPAEWTPTTINAVEVGAEVRDS